MRTGILLVICIILTSCATTPILSPQDVTPARISASSDLMAEYMLNQVQDDGSMTYRYLPDQDTYPEGNNMIRQFMATHVLGEIKDKGPEYLDAYTRNLAFNKKHYFAQDQNHTFIAFRGTAKLGSAAIASMAIQECKACAPERKELIGFLKSMQLESGRFQTFYIPKGIDRNHNFYPGEAMLALMIEHEKTDDESIIPIVNRSYLYYKDYFRNDSNPAFVPWQTMALMKLYEADGDRSIPDFIFEMNDFLVDIQHTSCNPDKRYLGRFYDPDHDEFGPPHSSSTAVYIEGLTYAYELAKIRGDIIREERYRNAILLGSRSIMELQYTEDNLWPADSSNKEKVIGGIRTTTLNPELRIDNTQHSLMAFIRINEVMTTEDFEQFHNAILGC